MKYILSIIFLILSMGIVRPVIATEPVVIKIEYALPYPGILPDHPLYFVKRVRDAVLEMVIIEPVRKSEFYILQADKRLQMGIMFIEQKKFSLAETTISKAEKYMEKAVTGLSTYKTSGGVIAPYVIEHAEKAAAKHAEVLQELLVQVPEAQKSGIASSLVLLARIQQEIKALK
ncbi:MAG: hypothetical protein UU25_C0013G0009 [Microgenomates group bacterium GW2011_GWB1_40_9]|nr:MAG: hypothetical protein UU25_C0013G0009 [Microgenomates group bacterium GW2011_GWB1_40_9]